MRRRGAPLPFLWWIALRNVIAWTCRLGTSFLEPGFGFFVGILRQVLCGLAPSEIDFNISQGRKVIVYSDISFSIHRASMGIVLLDCESGQSPDGWRLSHERAGRALLLRQLFRSVRSSPWLHSQYRHGTAVDALHLELASLKGRSWFEWVPSKANISISQVGCSNSLLTSSPP